MTDRIPPDNEGDDWKLAWDPVIAVVGLPCHLMATLPGISPDVVEAGAIRKYLEPLEFDCALHYDLSVAQAHGYPAIVAPYTAMMSFALLPMWQPGTPLFDSDERNAQPMATSVKPRLPPCFPPVTGYFLTDMEIEFSRPVSVGEIVRTEPGPMVSCEPKQTSLGCGAFVKIETRIVNQHGERLARMWSSTFFYNPHPKNIT